LFYGSAALTIFAVTLAGSNSEPVGLSGKTNFQVVYKRSLHRVLAMDSDTMTKYRMFSYGPEKRSTRVLHASRPIPFLISLRSGC